MAVHIDATIVADVNTKRVRVATCDACDIIVSAVVYP
jgi:hypothetical protein